MKNMKGIGLIVAAFSLAVLMILGISLESGMPLHSIHENIVPNPNVPFTQYSWLITPFNDTAGMTIARLELLIPSQVLPSSNNSLSMAVSVWHIDGTHLDSLKLTFSTLNTNIGPNVWFETPQGTQSSNALVYKDHGNSVVNIPDMGFMGTGSVNFDLFIQIYRTPITGNYRLTIQADMTLHESDYVFGGAGYGHTLGYPIVRHSFSGTFFVAFSIDPNGNISKYNQYL